MDLELYHVITRGIDGRNIFIALKDYLRGVNDLYEFNDKYPANYNRHKRWQHEENIVPFNDVGRTRSLKRERDPLVDIYAFCFMPNHKHILMSPRVENGIPLFEKKFNGGYVKFFNIKYDRKGTLFQGGYKSILIENDAHFSHILIYIHLNPLDLFLPEWRSRSLTNKEIEKCLEYLDTYRWSSHLDYKGVPNFPSVINTPLFKTYFGGPKEYERALVYWLRAPKSYIARIKKIAME